MVNFYIQDYNSLTAYPRPLSGSTAADRRTSRIDIPAELNLKTLSSEEFRAFATLAAHSGYVVNGRADSIVKYARKMPEAVFIDALFDSNKIRILQNTETGTYTIYWDLMLGSNWSVRQENGVKYLEKTNPADTNPDHNMFRSRHSATFGSLSELVSALNNFEDPAVGKRILDYLIKQGYVSEDAQKVRTNQLIYGEKPESGEYLLSWLEQDDIWTSIRDSYDYYINGPKNKSDPKIMDNWRRDRQLWNTANDADRKSLVLRRALPYVIGAELIETIYNNKQLSTEAKVASILDFWESSKALRSSREYTFELEYDAWVLGKISSLDPQALRDILQKELDEILKRIRENGGASDEDRRALDDLDRRARENGIPSITDNVRKEADDYKRLNDIYTDTERRARAERNAEPFRRIITGGKNQIDDVVKNYDRNAPIREHAERLKRQLDGIPEPRAVATQESLASVLNPFIRRVNADNGYADLLTSLRAYGATEDIKARANTYLIAVENMEDYFVRNNHRTDAQKIAAIRSLERNITALNNEDRRAKGLR